LGFSGFVILLALAATSFNRAMRWLGGKRWQMLHRGVYLVAVLAVLHFWWMRAGKQDFDEVLVYAAILGVLLGWRLLRVLRLPATVP
jgi:sulfoxide reductase heme-binding subunit YedZ